MRILITDGYKKADYLLGQLNNGQNHLVFVHDDKKFAQKMMDKYEIDVFVGSSSDPRILTNLEYIEFDVLICLSNSDEKNFVICKIAKDQMNVQKRITLISNPNNEANFKRLGIEGTVSASHLISNIISKMATVSEVMNFISIEDTEVMPYEIIVPESAPSIGYKLSQLNIPEGCVVCCIIRGQHSIIPNGNHMIMQGDRIVMFTNIRDTNILNKVFL